MTSSLTVSVIITTYNRHEFIDQAIDSVLQQTRPPDNIIIVDDGSDREETITHLGLLASRYPVHRIEHRGPSAARNYGRTLINTDIVIFLDDDDELGSEYIFETVKALEDDPNLSVAYTRAEFFGDLTGDWNLPPYDASQMLLENMVFNSAAIRVCDFDALGGYDESLLGREDHDLWIRYTAGGYRFYRIEKTLFRYRQTARSVNRSVGTSAGDMAQRYGLISRKVPNYTVENIEVLWNRIFELEFENKRYRRIYGRLDHIRKVFGNLVRR